MVDSIPMYTPPNNYNIFFIKFLRSWFTIHDLDKKFYNNLIAAYIECGEEERGFAELFAGVSYEVDSLT